MKSTIKVDYRSRYGDGDFGDKEPVIRIDTFITDDPRDTLLNEIFRNELDTPFPTIGMSQLNTGSQKVSGSPDKQFVLFKKSWREHLINDFASPIYSGLVKYSEEGKLGQPIFVTSSDEIYFECDKAHIRSKGITNRQLDEIKYSSGFINEKEMKFVQLLVEDFKEFEKKLNNKVEAAEPPQFFSRFSIGDEVAFTTPKAKDYAFKEAKKKSPKAPDEEIEYIPEYFWGKIVAVKFTEAKVWYDVLDDYSGKVSGNIPSHDVKMFSEETKLELKQNV